MRATKSVFKIIIKIGLPGSRPWSPDGEQERNCWAAGVGPGESQRAGAD